MILISNLILSISDGGTIASTGIYGIDKQTYINIGSGNVFKLHWLTPTLTNDSVDHYSIVIKRYDSVINTYYDIFTENVGLVNEFYVNSSLLPLVPVQYMLSIYVVAHGKRGSAVTSNVINPYISKGSGTYVKVENEYTQPIMKRAIAFAKVSAANVSNSMVSYVPHVLQDADGLILEDIEGASLLTAYESLYIDELVDSTGKVLIIKEATEEVPLLAYTTRVLVSMNGWNILQEGYTKDAEGNWHTNDIKFEVLVDKNGEIIEHIEDGVYKPVYVL